MSKFLKEPTWMVLFLVLLEFPSSFGANAHQTNDEKLVRALNIQHIEDAAMITDISVAGRSIQCGLFIKPPLVVQPVEPFHAGPDWLRNMAISLINRTNKPIAFAEISLRFLDTGDCRSLPCASEVIHIGQYPAVDAFSGLTGKPLRIDHPERPELNWTPGNRITVHVGDYGDEIEDAVSNLMPVTSLRNLTIQLDGVFFKDGMQWNINGYSTPDLNHPGKFKYLPHDFFPGYRGRNWPPGYNQ